MEDCFCNLNRRRTRSWSNNWNGWFGLTILQRLLDEHLDDVGTLADKQHAAIVADDDLLSSVDRRNRNADAEDFICLCKASLSFLKFEKTESVKPIGLILRAFCHTAIYADLIASNRVLPPTLGAQVRTVAASFLLLYLSAATCCCFFTSPHLTFL